MPSCGTGPTAAAPASPPERERPDPLFTGPEDFEGRANPSQHRRRWGRWAGRERDFYIEASRLAAPLRWDAIERLGGVELTGRAARVRAAFDALMSEEVPDHLRAGPVRFESLGGGRSVVETYSDTDPLVLPDRLLAVLNAFDGRPTEVVLEEIAENQRLELTQGLVRRLADFGVLRTSQA